MLNTCNHHFDACLWGFYCLRLSVQMKLRARHFQLQSQLALNIFFTMLSEDINLFLYIFSVPHLCRKLIITMKLRQIYLHGLSETKIMDRLIRVVSTFQWRNNPNTKAPKAQFDKDNYWIQCTKVLKNPYIKI